MIDYRKLSDEALIWGEIKDGYLADEIATRWGVAKAEVERLKAEVERLKEQRESLAEVARPWLDGRGDTGDLYSALLEFLAY